MIKMEATKGARRQVMIKIETITTIELDEKPAFEVRVGYRFEMEGFYDGQLVTLSALAASHLYLKNNKWHLDLKNIKMTKKERNHG